MAVLPRRHHGGPEYGPSRPADRAVTDSSSADAERRERLQRYHAARERSSPRVSREAFERLVAEALDRLPPFIQERMDNVAVIVEERATPEQRAAMGLPADVDLLGLYEGVNQLQRGQGYHLVLPDRVTLFR